MLISVGEDLTDGCGRSPASGSWIIPHSTMAGKSAARPRVGFRLLYRHEVRVAEALRIIEHRDHLRLDPGDADFLRFGIGNFAYSG